MAKGDDTRQAILDQAVMLASEIGLSGLSIGMLADKTGMSKSGLFAHFGSKEEMQLAVIREAQRLFADVVMRPAVKEKRGLKRLRAMVANGIKWTRTGKLPGGCPLMAAALEFDNQAGPVRDAVERSQLDWRRTLVDAIRMAMETGELRADVDPDQLAFEIVGIDMAAHLHQHLFRDTYSDQRALAAFDRLVGDLSPVTAKE